MFETELAVKHTPQDGTRIHIAFYLFTVQVMPYLLVFLTHMHILQHVMMVLVPPVMQICFMPP